MADTLTPSQATPVIAQQSPYLVSLVAGRSYLWCACGHSATQPFCDGSHQGTGLKPIRFRATETREAVLCGCKHTRRPPFCDGSHNNLSVTYKQAGIEEVLAGESIAMTPRDVGTWGKSTLDGGAFARTVEPLPPLSGSSMRIVPVVQQSDDAQHLSVFYAECSSSTSDIIEFPGSEVLLFVSSGTGRINIAGVEADVGPEVGIYVRPNESFSLTGTGSGPLRMYIGVCPALQMPTRHTQMRQNFDHAVPKRVQEVDPSQRQPMADRFYQVLIGEETQSVEATMFIGELPKSRAAMHRHLYEEAIVILSGEGFLWTEHARTPVGPGDIVFLPCKQVHSLECTSDSGLRLMGVFYPAGSPGVNY